MMKRVNSVFIVFLLLGTFLPACSNNTQSNTNTKNLAMEQARQYYITDIAKYQDQNVAQTRWDNESKDFNQLKITDVTLSHNSSYMIAEGSVKNIGTDTLKFVKIKASFKDKGGNVIDTDDTYACGDEGLEPDETTKFKILVDYDSRIQSVTAKVYDYD